MRQTASSTSSPSGLLVEQPAADVCACLRFEEPDRNGVTAAGPGLPRRQAAPDRRVEARSSEPVSHRAASVDSLTPPARPASRAGRSRAMKARHRGLLGWLARTVDHRFGLFFQPPRELAHCSSESRIAGNERRRSSAARLVRSSASRADGSSRESRHHVSRRAPLPRA